MSTARTVHVPVAAGEKHCERCLHLEPETGGSKRIRHCTLFWTELSVDEDGALRSEECLRAEVKP